LSKRNDPAARLAAEIRSGLVDFADVELAAAVELHKAAAVLAKAAEAIVDAIAQEKATPR